MMGILNYEKKQKILFRGINLLIKKGVFNPDPKITNSSSLIINNLPDIKDKEILDVGTGSGVISIYCALKGARKVIAVDIDEAILENAKHNIKTNKVEKIVKVIKSDLFENVSGSFDYIFGNLPISDKHWNLKVSTTNLMKRFIFESQKHLKKGGKIYFTWCSISDILPIKDYLIKNKFNFKELEENKLGYRWYLFEISFK